MGAGFYRGKTSARPGYGSLVSTQTVGEVSETGLIRTGSGPDKWSALWISVYLNSVTLGRVHISPIFFPVKGRGYIRCWSYVCAGGCLCELSRGRKSGRWYSKELTVVRGPHDKSCSPLFFPLVLPTTLWDGHFTYFRNQELRLKTLSYL